MLCCPLFGSPCFLRLVYISEIFNFVIEHFTIDMGKLKHKGNLEQK